VKIGQIEIHRVVESICKDFDPYGFFPETTREDWARHREWMEPRALDPASGNLVLPIQAFLVRTRRQTILVDTCVGHDKSRPQRLFWHQKRFDTFLPRLAAAGVRPQDVDYVMCTHLHADHVGWNTQLRDGRWTPTFPNAKYIFARTEWQAFQEMHARHPQPQFLDSVLPIMEAGQAQLVEADFALDDEVWLEPTPGHTPGHFCVRLASGGEKAVITGDCIHSPVQCVEPQWIMRADSDPLLARATRRRFLESVCDSGMTVCATHFPEPSIGQVSARAQAFWFDYDERPGL
jgi:glyoxylase-like metal-dependent hydrolase (beta-lactamase superfamily II)